MHMLSRSISRRAVLTLPSTRSGTLYATICLRTLCSWIHCQGRPHLRAPLEDLIRREFEAVLGSSTQRLLKDLIRSEFEAVIWLVLGTLSWFKGKH